MTAGCDRLGEIVIVPEFDLTYTFDGGLEGWIPMAVDVADPTNAWSIDSSGEVASSGGGAARLRLDDSVGSGKIWLERAFEVEPERAYDIELRFELASADTDNPWRIIAGVHTAPPTTAGDLTIQDPTPVSSDGYEWSPKVYTVRGTSDEEGNLFVALGIWATTAAARTYYLDNVRLLFTRVSGG